MWRHGALASLGFLSLASQAFALGPNTREPAGPAITLAARAAEHNGGWGRAWPRYERPRYTPPRCEPPRYTPPRWEHPRRPEPPPVFVPQFTQLETHTILDGRAVVICATIWRDECGRWNVKAAVRAENGCELPPIFSASLAVKSDRRWWRADMEPDSCDPRSASFRVGAGPDWTCDSDARVCLHLRTPGGRRMIQWDGVRVD